MKAIHLFNIFLLILVAASAIALITFRHDNRSCFRELRKEKENYAKMQREYELLLLKHEDLVDTNKVRKAVIGYEMHFPTHEETKIIPRRK